MAPEARVDEDDEDEEGQRHPVAQDEVGTAHDHERAQEVRDGHERPALEAVGEGAGRQGQQEPGEAVRRNDGGDGQRVGVDHHGQ